MRPSVVRALVPSLAVAALLLSGCMGNAVTVSGQGYTAGGKTKTLDCGGSGTLAMGSQGTGKLSVTVTDGDDKSIFTSSDFGAGQDGKAQQLTGVPGTWTLKVSTGLGYAGQWAITLTC
ncbi:MAG: hypothetical protein AABY18_08550 [Candidatus Thermoplasmatota archaeon]